MCHLRRLIWALCSVCGSVQWLHQITSEWGQSWLCFWALGVWQRLVAALGVWLERVMAQALATRSAWLAQPASVARAKLQQRVALPLAQPVAPSLIFFFCPRELGLENCQFRRRRHMSKFGYQDFNLYSRLSCLPHVHLCLIH